MRYGWTVILISFYVSIAQAETEVFFTPSPDCENQIIHQIQNAARRIDIAIYSLTHRRIARALIQAHTRGIAIRILADRRQATSKGAQILPLYTAGLDVRIHSVLLRQHNKFAVFDGKTVITGSYNWTYAASRRNAENCLLISDERKTVRRYQAYFEYLWQINKETTSIQWFEQQLKKMRQKNDTQTNGLP